jgi:hypothetical protein
MGLLEEAIREHLELQRRRGGDPTQIALAEREALEPLVPGHTPDWAEGPGLFDHETSVGQSAMPSGRPLVEPDQQPLAAGAQDQETAELDMSTVFGLPGDPAEAPFGYPADHPGLGDFGPVHARRIVPDPDANGVEAEDFEWEIPGITPSPRSNS